MKSGGGLELEIPFFLYKDDSVQELKSVLFTKYLWSHTLCADPCHMNMSQTWLLTPGAQGAAMFMTVLETCCIAPRPILLSQLHL
jgi:hypothetical protein